MENEQRLKRKLSADQFLYALENSTYEKRRAFLWRNARPKYPRYFYKYRKVSDVGQPHDSLRMLLVDSCVRLSSPRDFNDPFDVNAHIVARGNKQQIKRKLERLVLNNRPELRSKDRKDEVKKICAQGAKKKWRHFARKAFEASVSSMGIYCLTRNPRNILMWSHYAENHSGVCIQFELARDPRFLLEAMSVKYSDEFPEVNWFDEQMSEQLASTILNKHTGWQYEQEHRIVHIDKAGDFLKFKPEAISGIIIGAKLSPQKLERLHEILKERQEAGHPQIKIWRAQLAETRYKLAIFSEKKS